MQSILDRQRTVITSATLSNHGTQSKRLRQLHRKREHQINDFFNRVVKYLVDYCLAKGIGTLVVGHCEGSKNGINLGKVTNQHFVQIPYGKLLRKLKSKCDQMGIAYYEIEESYTSKCSFFDNESVEKHESYAGRRLKRGLFRTGIGWLVNEDVNGAANILLKYLASTHRLSELIRERVVTGFVNNPVRVKSSALLFSSPKAPIIPLCG